MGNGRGKPTGDIDLCESIMRGYRMLPSSRGNSARRSKQLQDVRCKASKWLGSQENTGASSSGLE